MLKIITKIWKLLPGAIGVAQVVLPLVKEIVVLVIRLIDVFTWSEEFVDEVIAKVNSLYDKVYGWVEIVKNYLLGV